MRITIHLPCGNAVTVAQTHLAALDSVLETVAADDGEEGIMAFFDDRHPIEDAVLSADGLDLYLFHSHQEVRSGLAYLAQAAAE